MKCYRHDTETAFDCYGVEWAVTELAYICTKEGEPLEMSNRLYHQHHGRGNWTARGVLHKVEVYPLSLYVTRMRRLCL